jgi:leader peptidase (prepilin peptidase)/N-methyltransferase
MLELFVFIFGLTIGSFLNVVIYRLPIMLETKWRQNCLQFLKLDDEASPKIFNLFLPRSHCPHCKKTICMMNNIPLLSFILQKGHCNHCKQKISVRYPLVELMTAGVSVLIFWQFGFNLIFLFATIFSCALIVLMFIDVDHQILPDEITLPLMWLGLLVNLPATFISIDAAVIGAIVAYLTLWSINFTFKYIAKKEGMGYGDFKLAAALGAWCGISCLPFIFLLASFLGLLVSLTRIALQKQERTLPIPFGPYLSIAGFIALSWGYQMKQYLPF